MAVEGLAENARAFAKQLENLAGAVETDFSKVVRKTVLDLFANIVMRSPVDTGTYRASHMIANHDPAPDEGVVSNPGKGNLGAFWGGANGWTWAVGDGTIYIFNNLPYAEPLENGHSKQAPAGVYRQALTEATTVMQQALASANVNGYFK